MDARRKKVLQTLLLTTVAVQIGLLKKNRSKVRRKRRWSVRPINKFRRQFGCFLNAFKAMKDHDSEAFFKYTRLNLSEFNMLAEMLEPRLRRRSCINTITVKERLAITLAYLAHGSSMSDVARNYLRGHSTVPGVIKTTCDALWEVLAPVYMAPPTREQWSSIKHEFYERWNMPNCLGAIDGKHIAIQSPTLSGSEYYNYKHFYSIHLMAIVDGDYKFIFVDIGAQGKCGDSGVFRNSNFGSAIITETLNIPQSAILPGTTTEFPCYFVADEAFPLRRNIMRPYSRQDMSEQSQVFNYRLSRARRVVENAFGILASRWRILRRPIIGLPSTVDSIVKGATVLHNFLRYIRGADVFISEVADRETTNGKLIPGTWRTEISLCEMSRQGSNSYAREVGDLRNCLKNYFNSEAGKLPWQ